MKRFSITASIILMWLFISGTASFAASESADVREADDLVIKAGVTLNEFMADRHYTWFHENLKQAKGILIFPQVIKAGFFWGGSGGTGVLLVRDEKSGEWSQPVFYTVGSVSFGFQIGAQSAEVVMLAMSQRAIDSLFASSVKLGGDVAVAAGPYGTGVKKIVTADFISFAKTKGLYAGLDFEGSGIAVRDNLNKAYYGRDVRPVEIIVKKEVSNPVSTKLRDTLRNAIR
jgi:lipid-binding SYLF domain-containing protein